MTTTEFIENYANLDEATRTNYVKHNIKDLLHIYKSNNAYWPKVSQIIYDTYFYVIDNICESKKDLSNFEDIKSTATVAFFEAIQPPINNNVANFGLYLWFGINRAVNKLIEDQKKDSLILKRLDEKEYNSTLGYEANISNEFPTPSLLEDMIAKEDKNNLLKDLKRILNEREFYVLTSIYGITDKKTQMELSKELNVTQSLVSVILRASINKCNRYYTKAQINTQGKQTKLLKVITIRNILTDEELKKLNIHTTEQMDKILLDAINSTLTDDVKEIMLSRCNFTKYLTHTELIKKYNFKSNVVQRIVHRSIEILRNYLLTGKIESCNLYHTSFSIDKILNDKDLAEKVLNGKNEKSVLLDAINFCFQGEEREIILSLAGFYGRFSNKEIADKFNIKPHTMEYLRETRLELLKKYFTGKIVPLEEIKNTNISSVDIRIALNAKTNSPNERNDLLTKSMAACLSPLEKELVLQKLKLIEHKDLAEYAKENNSHIANMSIIAQKAISKLYQHIVYGSTTVPSEKQKTYKLIVEDFYNNHLSMQAIMSKYNLSNKKLSYIIYRYKSLLQEPTISQD